ncbi:hypothetical protein [Streptomyces sp. Da 82-17]|uniref:hypothetical protein n=1 Tax=Streptomyces sp. Da 82-17 TaxID=3377116 RepID=UPI0038D48170
MAIAALTPSVAVGPISDPVTIKESVALFAETGHPVSESTLRRWIKRAGLLGVRSAGETWYSDSEILELHRDRVFGE